MTTTIPQYQEQQIIFTLSWLSNWSPKKKGTSEKLEKEMTSALNEFLNKDEIQNLIGHWDIVWGPAIYNKKKYDNKNVTNTMYVANRGNKYVIAIAGTNPYSTYDWIVEDFFVRKKVKWAYANSFSQGLNPEISEGTNIGLTHLRKDMSSSGKTIVQYLQELTAKVDSPIEIIVTGHSLGGALSSTLALSLLDTQSDWDPKKLATVFTQPSAGATPGDEDFSRYFQYQLGTHTNRIWNTIDIVPHAWNKTQLNEIPKLYLPEIKSDIWIEAFVSRATHLSGSNNYTQILPDTPGLSGKVHIDSIFDENTDKFANTVLNVLKQDLENEEYLSKLEGNIEGIKSFRRFMSQAKYQHTSEYLSLLDMEEIKPYFKEFLKGTQEIEIEEFIKLIHKILPYVK